MIITFQMYIAMELLLKSKTQIKPIIMCATKLKLFLIPGKVIKLKS